MENASREYSYEKISAMIERQKAKYGWNSFSSALTLTH